MFKDKTVIVTGGSEGVGAAAARKFAEAGANLLLVARSKKNLESIAEELRDKTIVKVLEKTDAFRRPGRFEKFLLTCEADARGRTGLEDRPYPQANLLRKAQAAAAAVDAGEIAKQTEPKKIPDAIRKARVRAVREVVTSSGG